MDSDTGKSRKGRKRMKEEELFTEEEQKKRQKNRDAAKRCREKKVREADTLKTRNTQLESENTELAKKKHLLESEVRNLMKVIKEHKKRGCKLTESMEAILDNSSDDESMYLPDSESECFGEIPQQLLSESSRFFSQPMNELSPNARDKAALQLFSGEPLLTLQSSHVYQSSVQSSPSQSPSPRVTTPANQVDLSDILMNRTIPQTGPLAPIRRGSVQSQGRSSNESSRSSIPSVVFEGSAALSDSVLKTPMSTQELMQNTLIKSGEEPALIPENNYTYKNINSANRAAKVRNIENSQSLPIFIPDDGDLENINQTSASNNQDAVVKKLQKPSQQEAAFNGSLNISTSEMMAPALLGIDPAEMQQGFHRQIIRNVATSPSTSASSSSPPLVMAQSQDQRSIRPDFRNTASNSPPVSAAAMQQQYMQNGMTETITELPRSIFQDQDMHKIIQIINRYQQQQTNRVADGNTNRSILLEDGGFTILLKPQPNGKHRVYLKSGENYAGIIDLYLENIQSPPNRRVDAINSIPPNRHGDIMNSIPQTVTCTGVAMQPTVSQALNSRFESNPPQHTNNAPYVMQPNIPFVVESD